MWILAHAGLPVGEWAARASHDRLFEMSYESYRDLATLLMDLSTGSFCLASNVLFASARRYPSRLCDMGLRHLALALHGFTFILCGFCHGSSLFVDLPWV